MGGSLLSRAVGVSPHGPRGTSDRFGCQIVSRDAHQIQPIARYKVCSLWGGALRQGTVRAPKGRGAADHTCIPVACSEVYDPQRTLVGFRLPCSSSQYLPFPFLYFPCLLRPPLGWVAVFSPSCSSSALRFPSSSRMLRSCGGPCSSGYD